MNMLFAIIKVHKVEPSPSQENLRFYRVFGTEEGQDKPEWYSCWDKDAKIDVDKLYSITYRYSKEDAKGRKYKNINDIQLTTKDGDNYVGTDTNVTKTTVTTTPIQKSYSELDKENHNDTRIEIVLGELKELKRTLDDLATYVYNNDCVDKKEKD